LAAWQPCRLAAALRLSALFDHVVLTRHGRYYLD
jgi:hypothetical protein